MRKIEELFSLKQRNILSVYCTAGYPQLDSTADVLLALQQHGADLVEIGIPYSDPIADGPVIQESNMAALRNGMSIQKLFNQLKDIRSIKRSDEVLSFSGNGDRDFHLPLILMGYLNPVMQYGFSKFCSDAKIVGVDGIILPDLPLHEFETEYQDIFKQNELDFIFLITPETSEDRIKEIDELSTGFIYAVSSSSTTGKDTDILKKQNYFQRLQQLKLKNPVLVGFGIKDKETFEAACRFTNGAIIGSAYIKALQNTNGINASTAEFLNKILK
jgi:tryptophan synthase alpha chain